MARNLGRRNPLLGNLSERQSEGEYLSIDSSHFLDFLQTPGDNALDSRFSRSVFNRRPGSFQTVTAEFLPAQLRKPYRHPNITSPANKDYNCSETNSQGSMTILNGLTATPWAAILSITPHNKTFIGRSSVDPRTPRSPVAIPQAIALNRSVHAEQFHLTTFYNCLVLIARELHLRISLVEDFC